MWCGKCQADVAAEVSPDNQRVFCTACGSLLSTIDIPPARPSSERSASEKTKDARELLARWSSGKVLDPFGPPLKRMDFEPAVVESPSRDAVNATAEWNSPAASAAASHDANLKSQGTAAEEEPKFEPLALGAASSLALPTTLPKVEKQIAAPALPSPLAPLAATASPTLSESFIPTPPPWASGSLPVSSNITPVPSLLASAGPTVAAVKPVDVTTASLPTQSKSPVAAVRVDAAHPQSQFASAANSNPMSPATSSPFVPVPTPTSPPRESRRSLAWFPTWDPAVWRSEASNPANWSSFAGQFLAYAGVLGLTAGACLVIWSYFGGPANYAPTGWLLATAGQMMLFFGVVTLVSGGLEQTTDQVNRRIEQLGDHIIRIEQAARELNLRSAVPPAHFSRETDAASSSTNERSVVEQ